MSTTSDVIGKHVLGVLGLGCLGSGVSCLESLACVLCVGLWLLCLRLFCCVYKQIEVRSDKMLWGEMI